MLPPLPSRTVILFFWLLVSLLDLTLHECICRAKESAMHPNVVVLLADDQRPDTVGALGNSIIQTPNLDRLVRDGSVFTRAVCGNPICTPSRAEILTGCSGFKNGVLDFGGAISPDLVTWADAMQAAGYKTWYVGKWHNNGRPSDHGYAQCRGLYSGGGGRWWRGGVDYRGCEVTGYRGWVFQTDDRQLLPEFGVGLTPDISARFADAAISVIREAVEGRPYFLHVNFTAPHDPLLMPPGFESVYAAEQIPLPDNFQPRHPFDHGNLEGRDERLLPWPRTPDVVRADLAAYYAVISHLDQQIGRILRAIDESGQRENTIVVFSSDHGLAVGSHGLRGKQNMYEHTVGVPMILRGPGVPSGRRFRAQIYLRDLYPTVCDLASVPVPESIDGVSARRVLSGDASELHSCVFGYFRDCQRMIRTERWKLIYYPQIDRYQLFDLVSDPMEKLDLADDPDQASQFAVLRQRLRRWQVDVGDPLAKAASPQP